jgi:hypothetical protein
MRFFFYGTLIDRDVMALVIGRRLPPQAFEPASITGFSRRRALGASFPVLAPDPKGWVEGVVVRGLSARDVALLNAYEGKGYCVVQRSVWQAGRQIMVSVFKSLADRDARLVPSRFPWELIDWQRRYKRAYVARVKLRFNGRPAYSRP